MPKNEMSIFFKQTAILTLVTAAFASTASALQDGRVELVGDAELRISGVITPSVAETFAKLNNEKIKLISISSEGGVTESAIEIAELIQKTRKPIRVLDFCLSSCANYLFVAGKHREVLAGAVVGWHGGHSFKPFRTSSDSVTRLAEKEKLLLREQLLYARAGVSVDLIVYSGLLTLGEKVGEVIKREYTLWVPPAQELRRLGIIALEMSDTHRPPEETEQFLSKVGMRGQSVYAGKAYSYIPSFLQKE